MTTFQTVVLVGGAAVIIVLIVQGVMALLSPKMKRGRMRTAALTYAPGEGVWLIIAALFLSGFLVAGLL